MTRRNRSGLPEYCSWNYDRHGKRRVRFRQGGFSTYLSGLPWSDDFMRQHAAALEGVKGQATNVGIERSKPGTINELIVSYYTLYFRCSSRVREKCAGTFWSVSVAIMATHLSLGLNTRTSLASS